VGWVSMTEDLVWRKKGKMKRANITGEEYIGERAVGGTGVFVLMGC